MIICGDSLQELKKLPDISVQCCVTSPPYWGLRDYGVEGQLGLEKTPQEYVANMVEIFREVRRALKDNGTLWINLGDSYCGTGSKGDNKDPKYKNGRNGQSVAVNNKIEGLKKKDLVGIPWRVAFALQEDGWYLRQDIIWAKPNPMPESVRDRCTKSHEYIFLLSKSLKYYFDLDAIKEPTSHRREAKYANRLDKLVGGRSYCGENVSTRVFSKDPERRNKRSVWNVVPKPFRGAHFATYPPDLIRPCILAGCPENGVVLDPFLGSGTTGVVCKELNRNFIGIELNPEYVELAMGRVYQNDWDIL